MARDKQSSIMAAAPKAKVKRKRKRKPVHKISVDGKEQSEGKDNPPSTEGEDRRLA